MQQAASCFHGFLCSTCSRCESWSSVSCSRGRGGRRLPGLSVGLVDREPGELSSESGSDEGINSVQGNNSDYVKMENGNLSPCRSKKRKFSPIVWDKEEVSNVFKGSTVSTPSGLPPPPPLPKSYRKSPNAIAAGALRISPVQDARPQHSEPLVEPVVDIV
ncbi:hypothetical protein AgCh_035413 [Apium graveolens]